MENITKKSWMKFGLDAEMMARLEVLLATGDLVFDDESSMVMLSEAALAKMTLNSGKNSRDKASTRENFPELELSNAHAAIEKENREEEGRPTGACTREWPSMPQEAQRWREAVTLWGKGAMLRAER